MLTWIRNKSSGIFMTVIMGVLILAFALWGVGDYFTQSSNDSLATVNGKTIKYSDFSNQFASYKQNMISQFGEGFDPSYFDSPMMKRSYLESMINSELIRQVARDNGFTVTAAEIRQTIEEAPAFKNENGQFDKSLYAAFLARTNQSAQLLQMKLEDEQAGQALNGMFDVTSFVTPFETKTMAKLNKQTRDINYILISPSSFINDITLSDDEIEAYYQENSSQYMTEEQVSVNYIELDAAEVAKSIEIDEAASLEYFEDNKERFRKPEQRLAAHILINESDTSQDTLAEIQAKLAAGEDFAELAKSYSQDPGSKDNGGDLGWVSPGDMVEEFDEALFSMAANSVSDVVKTQFGYHIIELKEIKESALPLFEEVKADIVQELQARESETRFLDLANSLSEKVLDSGSGLGFADEYPEFELKTSAFFGRSGGEGLTANQDFINAAFSSTVKDNLLNSDVIQLSDTHVVFMHLNETKPAELKPLDEVKDSIVSTLKTSKATDKARALADSIVKESKNGQSLADLAAQNELELLQAEGVTRTGSALPFSLVNNVFSMGRIESEGTHVEVLSANDPDIAVVELLSVNDVDVENIDDLSTESAQLSRNIKNNEQQLLIQALRESADVTINEELLNQDNF